MSELYHPFSEALHDEPWPIYRRLRDEAPAYHLAEFDCWFLSRFEDVWNAAGDPRFLAGLKRLEALSRRIEEAEERGGLLGRLERLRCVAGAAWTFGKLYLLPVKPNSIPARSRLQPVW